MSQRLCETGKSKALGPGSFAVVIVSFCLYLPSAIRSGCFSFIFPFSFLTNVAQADFKLCVTKDNLELLIPMPLLSRCRHYWCAPPHPVLCSTGDGTQGFLGARQVLYRLSYIPSPTSILLVLLILQSLPRLSTLRMPFLAPPTSGLHTRPTAAAISLNVCCTANWEPLKESLPTGASPSRTRKTFSHPRCGPGTVLCLGNRTSHCYSSCGRGPATIPHTQKTSGSREVKPLAKTT